MYANIEAMSSLAPPGTRDGQETEAKIATHADTMINRHLVKQTTTQTIKQSNTRTAEKQANERTISRP